MLEFFTNIKHILNITLYNDLNVINLIYGSGFFMLGYIIKKIYFYLANKKQIIYSIKTDFLHLINILSVLFFIDYQLGFLGNNPLINILNTYVIKLSYALLLLTIGFKMLGKFENILIKKASKTETKFDDQIIPFIISISKFGLFLVIILGFISYAGFNITSILAGLSIGGVAIGLASKDLFSNFFGSLTIFIDKPFQLGDRIKVSGIEGTIESIGLRVTTIRTFSDTLIHIPNSKFTTEIIDTISKMNARRIKEYVYLEYPNDITKIKKWKIEINSYIKDEKIFNMYKSNFIHIDKMDLNGLNIQIYIFTNTTNWGEWKDIKEDLFLKIIETTNKYGLKFSTKYFNSDSKCIRNDVNQKLII